MTPITNRNQGRSIRFLKVENLKCKTLVSNIVKNFDLLNNKAFDTC
jgi:hypothetical protein